MIRVGMRTLLAVIELFGGAVSARAQAPLTRSVLDSGTLVRMHTASKTVTGRLVERFQVPDTVFRFCRYPGPRCAGPEDSVALESALAAVEAKAVRPPRCILYLRTAAASPGLAAEAQVVPVLIRSERTGIFGPGFQGSVPGGVGLAVPAAHADRARELLSSDAF